MKRSTLFMLFSICWVLVVGNMFEVGENMRFRWLVDPFVLVIIVVLVNRLWRMA